MNDVRRETAEFVLPGHPDRLCDASVDSIVEAMRRKDPGAQCGLEAACVFDEIHLTGRIAGDPRALAALDIPELVRAAYREAGYGRDGAGRLWGPDPDSLKITSTLCFGPFENEERENRHFSDDQAICVGYATADPRCDYMPPAHWLSRKIARRLHELRATEGPGQLGPDGKVLVEIERTGRRWRPVLVSVSLNHHEGSDWLLLRRIAEQAVQDSLPGRKMPKILLNGAGCFLSGGPNGDNGLSGKKLVTDAYGPTVPIGGGAWSGKDLRKVDRLGGMLAREMALLAVSGGLAGEALIRLLYCPGSTRPAAVEAFLDGKFLSEEEFLERIGNPDLDNVAVWERYREVEIPLPELARWGHQNPETPWEKAGRRAAAGSA